MKHYLPNQIIVNLNEFLWSNPNNIMGIFSPAALFEAYCYTLWHSVGKSDYDWGSLMEWVSEELGPNANGRPTDEHTPLIADSNFIMAMQHSVVAGFSSFITDNRHFVMHVLAPAVHYAEQVLVAQDGVPNVMRLQYQRGEDERTLFSTGP